MDEGPGNKIFLAIKLLETCLEISQFQPEDFNTFGTNAPRKKKSDSVNALKTLSLRFNMGH